MIPFQMGSVKLHWLALKSLSDVYKTHLQRFPIPLFHLILLTNDLNSICINIFALTHIEPMFHFRASETF